MKKIYLTFDIETIVSHVSFNPTINTNILLGTYYIVKELEERDIKATLFIGLSPKTNTIDINDYLENVKFLIRSLQPFKNIKIQPHMHMKNLPLSFDTSNDYFSEYTLEQQVEALVWAKHFFHECGIDDVDTFRPGSYKMNDQYYKALNEAGYKYSASLKEDSIHYDMTNNKMNIEIPYETAYGIVEYPASTILINSIKGKKEILNLSPDFFTYESVSEFITSSDYININYHSFSIFTNRFARENHPNQILNNIKFLLFEKPLSKFLHYFNYELINNQTLFKKNFDTWLDKIEVYQDQTFFIGEQ